MHNLNLLGVAGCAICNGMGHVKEKFRVHSTTINQDLDIECMIVCPECNKKMQAANLVKLLQMMQLVNATNAQPYEPKPWDVLEPKPCEVLENLKNPGKDNK